MKSTHCGDTRNLSIDWSDIAAANATQTLERMARAQRNGGPARIGSASLKFAPEIASEAVPSVVPDAENDQPTETRTTGGGVSRSGTRENRKDGDAIGRAVFENWPEAGSWPSCWRGMPGKTNRWRKTITRRNKRAIWKGGNPSGAWRGESRTISTTSFRKSGVARMRSMRRRIPGPGLRRRSNGAFGQRQEIKAHPK